jgi:hypothetical protein
MLVRGMAAAALLFAGPALGQEKTGNNRASLSSREQFASF